MSKKIRRCVKQKWKKNGKSVLEEKEKKHTKLAKRLSKKILDRMTKDM